VRERCPEGDPHGERGREDGAVQESDSPRAQVGNRGDGGDRHLDGLTQTHREQYRLAERHQQRHQQERTPGAEKGRGKSRQQPQADQERWPWRSPVVVLPRRPEGLDPSEEQHAADERFHHLARYDRQGAGPEKRTGYRGRTEPEGRPRRD